jgi:FkbM family methyltransferase
MLQTIKQSKLYPLYFLVQFPMLLPRLIANEGWGGAVRWTLLRFRMLAARFVDRRPGFYEMPIEEFRSRLGFSLSRRAELLVYEEIFLDRCYAFAGFPELVKSQSLCVLDFGTHHGLFIDYLQTLNRECRVYGAEMGPGAFAVAQHRFRNQPQVHLSNVAIGGTSRSVRVGLGVVSVEQSLYHEHKDGGFEIPVVTPIGFLKLWNLPVENIDVIKIDIEGAEREVFENASSLAPLLQSTQVLVIEIHSPADRELIVKVCGDCGLIFRERRGINYFFRREKTASSGTKPD